MCVCLYTYKCIYAYVYTHILTKAYNIHTYTHNIYSIYIACVCMLCMYVPVCFSVCVSHTYKCPLGSGEGTWSPETGDIDVWATQCGYWDPNLCPSNKSTSTLKSWAVSLTGFYFLIYEYCYWNMFVHVFIWTLVYTSLHFFGVCPVEWNC